MDSADCMYVYHVHIMIIKKRSLIREEWGDIGGVMGEKRENDI